MVPDRDDLETALGAGLRVRNNLAAIEPAVGKEILRYLPHAEAHS